MSAETRPPDAPAEEAAVSARDLDTALVVVSHPEQASLTRRLADTLAATVAQAGGRAVIADLHEEGFDPRIGAADLAFYRGEGPAPAEVLSEQARIDRAAALVLVFPVYWWSMPALLKGWIDRVFTIGWAYGTGPDGRIRGLFSGRKVVLVMVAGEDADGFARHGYAEAMRSQIDRGIFGYCGIDDVTALTIHRSESRDDRHRLHGLEQVQALGAALAARHAAAPPLPADDQPSPG